MASRPSLAIGPANFAGQAYYWAQAVRQNLPADAWSFSFSTSPLPRRGGFDFPVHRRLPHHRLMPPRLRTPLLSRLLANATHVAADGFIPIFGRLNLDHVGLDLERLRADGRALALIAHGSDVRSPDRHMARLADSYFRTAPPQWVDQLRKSSARNRQVAESSGLPLFVSTPDLLLDLPTATWLPLTIDPDRWVSGRDALQPDAKPVVLHVPSRRVPPIKGTIIIDAILGQLHDEGRIEYLSPERVPNSTLRDLVIQSDVVVDQILTGSYGVAAVEGMAAGRLVVGSISPDVSALMPVAPPVISTSPANFSKTMQHILDDRETYAAVANSGPDFVRRWHGGSAAAEALRGFVR